LGNTSKAVQKSQTVFFSDNKSEENHGRRSLQSGAITIVSRIIIGVIQIGSVFCMARLLSPEDYGLVSMVTAITGFAPGLVDLGTRDAVAQRARITTGEVSALFWITMAIGCTGAVIVAAAGPFIARFYGEPRLTAIASVSALVFITTALYCQHYALLRRAMKFQELGAIEVGANLLSAGGAITMAYFGFSYWALVLRPVALTALLAAGVWLACRWLPLRPTLTRGVKDMMKFGAHIGGFGVTDFASRSSDRIAIGYRNGAHPLGYYQNALFVYDNLLDVMVAPLHGVAISSLSKVRHDLHELRRLWSKALSTLAFYSMPAFGLLAVTSQDLIVLLLGAKWAHTGVLLSILAFRGMPHSMERTLGWLHVAAGRSDRWNRWGFFAASIQLVALFAGLPFGTTGVVVAYVVCMFFMFVPTLAYAGKPLGIKAADVAGVVWRQMSGALLAAAIGFGLRYTLLADAPSIIRLVALAAIYAAIYLVTVVGLFRLHTPIGVMVALARDLVPTRIERLLGTRRFFASETTKEYESSC
jgi:PST family polysaccharide transporter